MLTQSSLWAHTESNPSFFYVWLVISKLFYIAYVELISGAISMGLGGYLAARSEADHYYTERRREEMEVEESEEEEIQEIIGMY